MAISKVDRNKLRQAIERFGSLQNATQHLEEVKSILEKANIGLKQENEKSLVIRDKLSREIELMKDKINSCNSELRSLFERIERYGCQYELFCGFMAMVAESPSVDDSLGNVIKLFQRLLDTSWYISKNATDMRSLFVRNIMGDYLKCFRCDYCGAKFITNKKPEYKTLCTGYYCPVCHNWYAVKEDDSFLQALVSEQTLEDVQRLDKLLGEYEALRPFKDFFSVRCEICGKPVNEWDEQNIKLVISGMGCGHTQCWNSQLGQWRQIGKAVKKVKYDLNQG
jgi:FtsZ-binding cell division protein ZapB